MQGKIFNSGKLILVIVLLMAGTGIFAQPGFGIRTDSSRTYGRDRIFRHDLDLTEDQQEKITALRDPYQKEIMDIRNDIAIKRAELQKLQSAEEVDLNEVNRKLDEIGQLTTEITKKNFALEQNILNLLTDEQKSAFRSRPGRHIMPYEAGKGRFNSRQGRRGFDRQSFMAPRHGMTPYKRF